MLFGPIDAHALTPVRGLQPVQEITGSAEISHKLREVNCHWRQGSSVLEGHPGVRALFDQVSAMDWYFGGELRREFEFMRWCRTSGIFPGGSTGGVTFAQLLKGQQKVVYRYMDTVYVDAPLFDRVDPRTQNFLLLHGLLQSYLPAKGAQRGALMIGALNLFSQIEAKQIRQRTTLHAAMKTRGLNFPVTVTALDRHRAQIEFLLGTPLKRSEKILNAADPMNLIQVPDATLARLAEWDQILLRPLPSIFEESLELAMARASLERTRELLEHPRMPSLLSARAALRALEEFSPEKRIFFLAHPRFSELLSSQLGVFQTATIGYKNGKPLASPFLQALGTMPAERDAVPLIEVLPRAIGADQMKMPAEVTDIVRSIALLANQGEWAEIALHFTENPEFYSALSLAAAAKTLRDAGDEKSLLHLKEIREGFLSKFFDQLAHGMGLDTKVELYRRIHFDRLD